MSKRRLVFFYVVTLIIGVLLGMFISEAVDVVARSPRNVGIFIGLGLMIVLAAAWGFEQTEGISSHRNTDPR